MVTLSSCPIWQILVTSFILPPNEYDCVYAWTTLGNGPKKNHLFRWSSFWFGAQKTRKQTYIEKPTQPKRVTVWCGFWSKRTIGPFFFENEQVEAVTGNSDRYRAILNEFLFTKIEEEENIGNIWFQQDGAMWHTAEATLDVLRPVLKIALSAFELMLFGHLGATIWYHWSIICGVASKIGEIQLHTSDNVLKNWTDRV